MRRIYAKKCEVGLEPFRRVFEGEAVCAVALRCGDHEETFERGHVHALDAACIERDFARPFAQFLHERHQRVAAWMRRETIDENLGPLPGHSQSFPPKLAMVYGR